jgi:hypothetical protein
MSLLNRNPLITNPSLGYIGWILLACTFIDKEIPDIIHYGMWIIVGISYMASGIHKLQCESWLDGSAIYYVLTSSLARQNFIVETLLQYPFLLKFMSWSSLFLEISALFLGTFYRTRKYYWLAFMAFHFGILVTVKFADLTWGMIIAHLFTFDPRWIGVTVDKIKKVG